MAVDSPLLSVDGLKVVFPTRRGPVRAVDGMSYTLEAGRTLGVVGESGCGKSVAALALLGLVDPPGRVTDGIIRFAGADLRTLDDRAMESVRGKRIAMIFQEPMTALNPVLTIGEQVAEPLIVHENASPGEALERAIGMLGRVGISDAARRAGDYPHQLSGGLRQRAMIAMALICAPDLLIADEPTTALDVTIQAQILDLIRGMQAELGMAVQLISHDLGVMSETADTIAVIYAGRIVERAPAADLFATPRHPYTMGLLATAPRIGAGRRRLPTIAGAVPDPTHLPSGCAFRDRCPRAIALCAAESPALEPVGADQFVACHRVEP